MMYRVVLFLSVLLLAACKGATNNGKLVAVDSTKYHLQELARLYQRNGENSIDIKSVLESEDVDMVLKNKIKRETQFAKLRRGYLANEHEPDLSVDNLGYQSCCFRFVNSFERNYYVIRVDRRNNKVELFFKVIKGASGMAPNVKDTSILLSTESKILDVKSWDTLMDKLDNAYFWSLTNYHDKQVLDGSYWMLTASVIDYDRPLFNSISRVSPDDNCFRDACAYMIRLAGKEQVMGIYQ